MVLQFDIVRVWSNFLVDHLDACSSAVGSYRFVRVICVMEREFFLIPANTVGLSLLVDEKNSSHGSLMRQISICNILIIIILISHLINSLNILLLHVYQILALISLGALFDFIVELVHKFY